MTSGKDLTNAQTRAMVGWHYCRDCGFPYETEDLVPVNDSFTGQFRYYLCRWHSRRGKAVTSI